MKFGTVMHVSIKLTNLTHSPVLSVIAARLDKFAKEFEHLVSCLLMTTKHHQTMPCGGF